MEGKKLLTVRDILYIFFKNKILIVSVFASAVIFSSFYCLVTPPVYRGETKVLVKMGKSNFAGMEAMTEQRNVLFQERSQNIRNEIELIKGQYLTEKVIARLKDKIEPLREDKSIIGRTIGAVKKGVRELLILFGISKKVDGIDKEMVLTFMNSLTVRFLEDTDMISIGFDWTDPKFAALVANVYADEYVTQHTLVYETQRSHKFYVDQIELYEKKLKEAEDNLQNFLTTTNIANITLQKELLVRNLADLNNKLNLVAVEQQQALTKVNKVREMMKIKEGWIETPEFGSHLSDKQAYLRTLDDSYFKLKVERDRLLKIYTPQSNEIKAIDYQLANLRKQKAESILNIANMELSLTTNRKNSLMAEIAAESKKLEDINSKTVELNQLERQKELIEQNYKIYKKKAEELRISDDLDSRRISSIRIATPAIPPLTPIYPKKGFIIGASAILGLFLSFGFSAIREFFNHTFKDDNDVFSVLGIPLLVSVPLRITGNGFKADHKPKREGILGIIFGRRFYPEGYKKPVTPNIRVATSNSNNLAFVIFVMLGIGGYFFYMYQNMLIYQTAIETQRNLISLSNMERQVTVSSVAPMKMLSKDEDKLGDNIIKENKAENSEMMLLSDELEKRRKELEKQRAEITVELEKIRKEIEDRRLRP